MNIKDAFESSLSLTLNFLASSKNNLEAFKLDDKYHKYFKFAADSLHVCKVETVIDAERSENLRNENFMDLGDHLICINHLQMRSSI